MVAAPSPGLCLARSCGCFSCLERCPEEAITLVPSVGVEVDSARCTGCGICQDLCPTFPKAIVLARREPAENAG
nr:4Fe-4S dicluster domain-containing protein [Geomonas sp. Red32]